MKNSKKTLSLKKRTVTELNENTLSKVVGGTITGTTFIGSERSLSSWICTSNQTFDNPH